jgi:ABC-type glycerol-3-phosphate transport system substrate-binding protein
MRRVTFRLMLLVFAAGYLAAVTWVCLRPAAQAAARPVTIRFAHWQIERGPPEGLAAVIRRYEELHPRVRVEQVRVPSPIYRQWLRTNLAGRTATDLIEFAYFLGGMNDVPVRHFEPLTAAMSRPNPYNRGTPLADVPWRLTFADGLYYMLCQSPEIGQIYGATLAQASTRLFCNRALLEKITGGPAVAPATLADFRRLCAQVADYSRRTGHTVYPLAGSQGNAMWLTDFLLAGTVASMNLELDEEGYLARSPWQAQADYLRGRWSYRRPELRAALTLVRELTQQMRPGFIVGTSFEVYLNKDSPHKAEALDFLYFLTSVEGGQLFMDHSGWISSVRGVRVPRELEIYRPTGDGYTTGMQYMGVGANSTQSFWQNYHLLVSPQGSVAQFIEALEPGLPKQVTEDLRREVNTSAASASAVDCELMALGALHRLQAPDADRAQLQRMLAANQTQSEINGYEASWVLARQGVGSPAP